MYRAVARMVGVSVVVGICCVVGVGGVRAEAHQDAAQDAGQHRLNALDHALQLTEPQKHQLQQITQDYQARRKQLRDQLEALRQEEDGKIKAILTPEQQAKFDHMQQRKADRRKEWKQGLGHHEGSHRTSTPADPQEHESQ